LNQESWFILRRMKALVAFAAATIAFRFVDFALFQDRLLPGTVRMAHAIAVGFGWIN
jgi:hypothetical protein